MHKTASYETDAYDRMSADEFIRLAIKRTPKKPHLSGKQKRELNRLIRTQATGQDSKKDWWTRYHGYTHSERWKRLKTRIIRERGRTCERCGKSDPFTPIHLHHLTYARLRHEAPEDLQLLCEPCHKLMHPGKEIGRVR